MTSHEDFKRTLLETAKTLDEPIDEFHDLARMIVNIERQSFYGDDSSVKRLGKIREAISNCVKGVKSNEV